MKLQLVFQALAILGLLLACQVSCIEAEDVDLDLIDKELQDQDLSLDDIDLSILFEQYSKYDLDGDNKFDINEFYILYKESDDQDKFTDEIIQIHFFKADTNKDDFVDFHEILSFSLKEMAKFQEEFQQGKYQLDGDEGQQQEYEQQNNEEENQEQQQQQQQTTEEVEADDMPDL